MQNADKSEQAETTALSYKFQRLREKLRQAVASGELSGKLPGERALAKRFHVNAKTLSKALTDLAAEGLLDRSIGRGTFVKGTAPVASGAKRWLVLCDADQVAGELMTQIRNLHPDLEVAVDLESARPSFINQFSAVVDLSTQRHDALIRSLVVRSVPLVLVGEKSCTFSTHAVQCDYPLAVSMAGRDLLLAGHRKIAAVERRSSSVVASNLRVAALRYAPQAQVDACFPQDARAMFDAGVTAFVCGSCDAATAVREQLDRIDVTIPGQMSLMAVGISVCDPPCSGYFVPPEEKAAAVAQLLSDTHSARPATIWLAPHFVDRKTVAPLAALETQPVAHYRDVAV